MHLTKFSAGFAALVLASIGAQATVGPNENSGIFKALCTLISFAESPPPLQTSPADGAAEIAELQALNMSLAAAEWQAKLDKADPNDDSAKIKEKAGVQNEDEVQDLKKRWKTWAEARKATNQTTALSTKINKAGFTKLTGAARTAAAIRVRAAAERAQHFYELRKALQSKLDSPTPTELQQELEEAAFGAKGKKLADVAIADMFANPAASDRPTACAGAISNGNAKSLAAILMCVCAESDTNHDGACAHKVGTGSPWNAASIAPSAATAAWNAIKTACVPAKKAMIDAATLRNQLHKLAMQVHRGSDGNHYLGALDSGTSCSGANNAGVCVKYTNYNPTAGKGLETTQWGQKLILLKAIQAEAMTAMATAVQTATSEWPTAPSSATQAGATTAGKKGKTSAAEEECNAVGEDKTECDKLEKQGCTFNTESKKCELKKDVKQALEKAKENEGTSTTEDCSKLLTQQACEDAKKDGKKHCGWKKGGDSDPGKDKEKCRNGSFLLTKKFALSVVSAAFAALLF
ncbi:Trypanosomal VSG domain/Trypanosome variant surface glycoprotein C-terminal domain containing protein, putative [Trypanosoma equiperdum]|uniref:Trypanosomal VSG domain/Trypanosome variant surface glycoprotein C-terminal domain containing protein, putative n=1 Tax=Trypanosoma equiperdum TaxID=5694 RepID=A0A1G4I584_TRYEQ|nr:Trypanosomal VSG domain/Trypanosome variant surface glycoprotein C-terminal domain containing protein, putative [Trypanosoma equiperdum]